MLLLYDAVKAVSRAENISGIGLENGREGN